MLNILHIYLITNFALAVGYIFTRTALSSSILKLYLTPLQCLLIARNALLGTVGLFFAVPFLLTTFKVNPSINLQLQPMAVSASTNLLQNPAVIKVATEIPVNLLLWPIIHCMLLFSLLLGASFFATQYFKNNFAIRNLLQKNCHQRILNNLHILFSNHVDVPFCWSWLNKSFVVLPVSLLTQSADLKLVLHHEIQHIRQHDTRWLHFLALAKILCFWNPFLSLWSNWFTELQEFACDAALVTRRDISPIAYGECLLNLARISLDTSSIPCAALGIIGSSSQHTTSILHRRITMLFLYQKQTHKKLLIFIVSAVLAIFTATAAYALNASTSNNVLSLQQLKQLVNPSYDSFTITPAVVAEVNNIRANPKARAYMRASLQRMQQYQPLIQAELQHRNMPTEILALPLAESGYQQLDASRNPVQAAGIWQIVPSTAKNLGLTVDAQHDDRLDTQLATNAALNYLAALYAQYKDWNLAMLAYEIGEDHLNQLIQTTHSRDIQVLAQTPFIASTNHKDYLPLLGAAIIFVQHPELVS